MATVTPIDRKTRTDVLERIAAELRRANLIALAVSLPDTPDSRIVRNDILDAVGRELHP